MLEIFFFLLPHTPCARVCALETVSLFWEFYNYEGKKQTTTVLQSSSVLYTACIRPLNFQVGKQNQVVIRGFFFFLPYQ